MLGTRWASRRWISAISATCKSASRKASSALKVAVCEQRRRIATQAVKLTGPEAAFGLTGYAVSFSPSLLPRPWYAQGLIAGIGAMSGYQFAVLTKWSGRMALRVVGAGRPAQPARLGNVRTGLVLGAVGGLVVPLVSLRHQRYTARYVGHPEPGLLWVLASTGTGVATFTALQAQWTFTQRLIDSVHSRIDSRYAWGELSRLVATLVTLGTEWLIVNKIVWRGVLGLASTAANRVDQRVPLGIRQPVSPLHSGSAESLERWDQLGLQGKRFVAAGPSRAQILHVMGSGPAKQPIRAYASLRNRSIAQVVEAVIAELDRTEAWQRSAILLTTTTGRGNVNEWSASAFEYLMRGDCASVALQYSKLPSALTLLSAGNQPSRASGLLLARVEQRLAELDPQPRPKIFLGGESLGAYGSCGIFTTPAHMLNRIDGAVFTGCPAMTPMLQTLIDRRDPGSPATMPTFHRGRHIRFAGRKADFDTADNLVEWTSPRVAFLQNETDPVAFWSPRLLWRRPPWAQEPRRVGPMAQMTWLPLTTFWQLAADMPVCRSVGPGFGHKYDAAQTIPAWAHVLGHPELAQHDALDAILRREVPLVNP